MPDPAARHHRPHWRAAAAIDRHQNLRGPLRALTYEEQDEVHRALRTAPSRGKAAMELAKRYGVSSRTIWRYALRDPLPQGTEFLRTRLHQWAKERDIALTHDDMVTLIRAVLTLNDLLEIRRQQIASEVA